MKISTSKNKFGNRMSYDFVSKALSCHAICLISEAGLLAKLLNSKSLTVREISGLPNFPLIQSALLTLAGSEIIEISDQSFTLTDAGKELAQDISMISLPLVGYGKLLSKQYELLKNPDSWNEEDIDYKAIAESSINFGEENINLTIKRILDQVQPRGTICDMGCGSGAKLIEFCHTFNVSGLGIDKDPGVIEKAKRSDASNNRIEFITGDILRLEGVWEDVDVVMSNFVLHDLHPDQLCIEFMDSITTVFPRCRCIIISDIVSYSKQCPSIMPGFDYVHGLQGFLPRNLEKTLEIFEKSGFEVIEQVAIPNMRNTFIWTLKPSSFNE